MKCKNCGGECEKGEACGTPCGPGRKPDSRDILIKTLTRDLERAEQKIKMLTSSLKAAKIDNTCIQLELKASRVTPLQSCHDAIEMTKERDTLAKQSMTRAHLEDELGVLEDELGVMEEQHPLPGSYDPLGNPKRLAKEGESQCGDCKEFRIHDDLGWPCCGHYEFSNDNQDSGCNIDENQHCQHCGSCTNCKCTSEDYAGGCQFFRESQHADW